MFVTLHTGSSEVVGRLRLLESDRLEPGDAAWAQIKTEQPIAAVKGDCFVIRSNQTTLGGGNIVELHARRHRRRYSPILERLELMLQGSDRDVLLKSIEASEPAELETLVNRANMEPSAARAELRQMAADGLVVSLGNGSFARGEPVYTAAGWADLSDRATAFLDAYHASHPLRPGAPREELRSRLGLTPQLYNQAIPRLVDSGVLTERDSVVHRPGHTPRPSPAQTAAAERYVELLALQPYSPPTDDPPEPELVSMLADEGKVVRVSDTVVFTSQAYAEMTERISAFRRRARTGHSGRREGHVRHQPQVRHLPARPPRPAGSHPPRGRRPRAQVDAIHGALDLARTATQIEDMSHRPLVAARGGGPARQPCRRSAYPHRPRRVRAGEAAPRDRVLRPHARAPGAPELSPRAPRHSNRLHRGRRRRLPHRRRPPHGRPVLPDQHRPRRPHLRLPARRPAHQPAQALRRH